jgi:hypothetical protein
VRTRLPVTIYRRASDEFSPTQISGLALWLDASDDAQVTADVGITTWRDKSGNGRNATQGVGTKQPIRSNTINGKKVLTFQGSDDTMSVANVAAFNATSQTIIVVSRQSAAANQALFYKASATSANGVVLRYRTGTTIWLYQKNDGTSELLSNNSNTNTNTNVYTTVLQPTSQAGFVNGSAPTNGLATNTVTSVYDDTGALWIGSRRDIGEYLAGDVCEVLWWPRALSTAERQQCERYLGGKWGITVA